MATVIFLAVTVAFVIYPLVKLVKIARDTTLGWAESIKAFLLPTSLQVLAIKKQYKTIASLTANVDSQPKISMYDPAAITHQLKDIRARLAVLENAGNIRPIPAHNPAIYSPIRPSAPITSATRRE